MSFSIGAALKRIAAGYFIDPKALKHFGMTVLVILVTLMMPLAAITAVFSGTVEIDSNKLTELVMANLSDEERAMLQEIANTINAIDVQIKAKGFDARVKEAQVLYLFALSDRASEPDFVERLVGCFSSDP